MNIPNLKYYKNKIRKINLTESRNTPQKNPNFSYSNPLTVKQSKSKYRNKKVLNDYATSYLSFNNIKDKTQKYIFINHKVSPLIASLIYEKAINKLFGFIKKTLPKNIFIELKKKYIQFVTHELHVNKESILSKKTENDLSEINIKLFLSQNNSNYLNYTRFMDNYKYKLNSSSTSFMLNKIKLKPGKVSSFNSFNKEKKTNIKSLINSSKILVRPKNKMENVCNTEYNKIIDKKKSKTKKPSLQDISKFKPKTIQRNGITNNINNIYITNPLVFPTKEIKKKFEIKEKIRNKENNTGKIFIKLPINKTNKLGKEREMNDIKEGQKRKNKEITEMKDNEKYSINQLNIIKDNLEDNLKNMFNFSYGNFLNNEKDSDSSKSFHDIYKFSNYDENNFKQV